jgi:hypothetical protein
MPTPTGTDVVAGVGTPPGAAVDTPTAGTVPGSDGATPGCDTKSEARGYEMEVEDD